MRKKLSFAAIIPLLTVCCTMSVLGPKEPLIPEGEPVYVSLASGSISEGELLSITNAELILLEQGGLIAVRLSEVRKVYVTRYEIAVTGKWREKLALYCRYPQGLSDEQWQLLLREAGQSVFARPGDK